MEEIQVITAWKAKKQKNASVNSHSHYYHELVYYSYGEGTSTINGKVFSFSGSCFVVIPKMVAHQEFHNSDTEVICIGFLSSEDLQIGFFPDASHTFLRIFNDILREVSTQPFGYKKMLEIKLNELLLNADRAMNSVSETKNFEYAINYIRENFHERIDLSDCAKQLNLSYDYFQHKFKTVTGYSPKQFLTEQRLLAGKEMLEKGNCNCTEIAYQTGFCTCAQFSAMYKKRFGITPVQYKKAYSAKRLLQNSENLP